MSSATAHQPRLSEDSISALFTSDPAPSSSCPLSSSHLLHSSHFSASTSASHSLSTCALECLSKALTCLASDSDHNSFSKPKVHIPDLFDGSDPALLRPFLVQCKLNFQAYPHYFCSHRSKVTFAQSYLQGSTLEWFEPDLLSTSDDAPPAWLDDYQIFLSELVENFGPHDPVGDAEARLEQLRMANNARITEYVVEFNRLATIVRAWGDGALRRQFYNGLPPRIKDEITRQGKPASLRALKTLAQTINACYWERCNETLKDSVATASSACLHSRSASPTPSVSSSASASSSTHHSSAPHSPHSVRAPSPLLLPPPDLSDILGEDGKLTAEERQRHLDNELCLFCGGPGHSARDCTAPGSRANNARTPAGPEAKLDASSEV